MSTVDYEKQNKKQKQKSLLDYSKITFILMIK